MRKDGREDRLVTDNRHRLGRRDFLEHGDNLLDAVMGKGRLCPGLDTPERAGGYFRRGFRPRQGACEEDVGTIGDAGEPFRRYLELLLPLGRERAVVVSHSRSAPRHGRGVTHDQELHRSGIIGQILFANHPSYAAGRVASAGY